jgi:hypothetical protein
VAYLATLGEEVKDIEIVTKMLRSLRFAIPAVSLQADHDRDQDNIQCVLCLL